MNLGFLNQTKEHTLNSHETENNTCYRTGRMVCTGKVRKVFTQKLHIKKGKSEKNGQAESLEKRTEETK